MKKGTKIVRLRESTFSELRKLGEMGNDTDDIVSMLLEFGRSITIRIENESWPWVKSRGSIIASSARQFYT